MLEVKPIQTKKEQQEICELCEVEFAPDCFAYSATENEKLLGIAQFRIFGEYAVIYDLKNIAGVDDLGALIIMGKAALNFIDLCGVKQVVLNDACVVSEESNYLPQILKFDNSKDGVYKLNLEGYFNSPCQSRLT